MNRCEFTELARADLQDILTYIAADSLRAALRWIERIEQQCQRLAEMPGMGRRRDDLAAGLRSFPVGLYLIFYREVENGVQIVRVLHGARDVESFFP
jgi:toxin ParE1/3/4